MLNAGTVRCHEAVTKLPGEYDVVINIQGDEPLIEPEIIDDTVRALQNSPDCVYRSARICCCANLLSAAGTSQCPYMHSPICNFPTHFAATEGMTFGVACGTHQQHRICWGADLGAHNLYTTCRNGRF